MKPKNKNPRDIGFYVLIFIILVSAIYLLTFNQTDTGVEIEYADVCRLIINDTEKVEAAAIKDNTLTLKLTEEYEDTGSDIVTHELYDVAIFYEDLEPYVLDRIISDDDFSFNYEVGWQSPWWFQLLPYAILIIVMVVLWNAMINRSGVGGDKSVMKFGKARTRLASEEKKKVTFADVAGAEEEKEELREIVDFLKGPQKYISLGARIPKGVLLIGPPGTGKTLLAKAVAGEAGVQFLSISGSDFVELYVGVGASRVRDLFDQAKKLAPAIIFIDEIDAVGRQRGAGLGGGHDEREQTLNQLLVEMDGFSSNEGVIVMAATNRSDILDTALLRPGRFDRQVYVGLPDIKGREAILRVHARGKVIGDDVDLASIARGTVGFTGADLENLLNEAALLAARYNKRFITMSEVEGATLKVIAGPEKKSSVVTEKSRRLTAFHEAGHAVAGYYLENIDPVHHITIIPHGAAGGMTITRPEEDRPFQSKGQMFENIIFALGGRMAESLMLDDISTGASSDIQKASAIARAMVTKYGMSDKLGPISFDDSSHSVFIGRDFSQTKSYSEKTAATIDDEVKSIFDRAMIKCEELLTEHKNILQATAEYLLENETMDGDDFAWLCDHDGQKPPRKKLPDAGITPEPAQPEAPEGLPNVDDIKMPSLDETPDDGKNTEK